MLIFIVFRLLFSFLFLFFFFFLHPLFIDEVEVGPCREEGSSVAHIPAARYR